MQRNTSTDFWKYLSQKQIDLILQGDFLREEVIQKGKYNFKDYSFIVFPYAKAFEGYLKQLFKDIGFISHLDYISDHLRLGKLMSPNLVGRLGDRSLYTKMTNVGTKDLADKIWMTWKEGRNQIFHYFPHNLKAISLEEAEAIMAQIMSTMELAYDDLYPMKKS